MLGLGMALGGRRGGPAGFDLAGPVLPPGTQFARAGSARYTAADGRIATAAAGVPRFDHDPVTGARLGLLIEPAATNIVLHATAPGGTGWTASGLTVTPAPSPDGGNGALRLGDASASGFGVVDQAVGAGLPLVASLYVAKDTVGSATRFVLLRLAGRHDDVVLDTATGATASPASPAGAIDAGGWWRLWVGLTAPPTAMQVYPAAGSGVLGASYLAAAVGAATVWGAQIEGGDVPTSPIATGASAATRAADVLRLDWGSRGAGDGPLAVRYRFADGSHALRSATVSGGWAAVPGDLPRRHLIAAERA